MLFSRVCITNPGATFIIHCRFQIIFGNTIFYYCSKQRLCRKHKTILVEDKDPLTSHNRMAARDLDPVSISRPSLPGIGIPMLKIRRSRDRLIFNIGIPILVRRHLYIETAPGDVRGHFVSASVGKRQSIELQTVFH